jgi:hypothetical protein
MALKKVLGLDIDFVHIKAAEVTRKGVLLWCRWTNLRGSCGPEARRTRTYTGLG